MLISQRYTIGKQYQVFTPEFKIALAGRRIFGLSIFWWFHYVVWFVYKLFNKHYSPYCSEVRQGWWPLLLELVQKIESLEKKYKLGITVAQIKEKFGGLRFYIDFVVIDTPEKDQQLTEVYEVISEYEQKSLTVCEYCGAPGTTENTKKRIWIKTLCKDCAKIRR